jgi:monoamine oxidase
VRFDPPLDEKIAAARRLAVGPVTRATLVFDAPFWEIEPVPTSPDGKPLRDLCFMHAPGDDDSRGDGAGGRNRPPFPSWWTLFPLHAPVLVGWAGGPPGERLSHRGPDAVRDAALASLATFFGLPRAEIERRLVSLHTHDWQADPFARGAYSYVPVGGLGAMKTLAEPVDGTIFFAGEATHHEGMSGTVAGAIASGQRAAREVLGADDGR